MSAWSWNDVYPDRRAITLLLTADEADLVVEAAREAGWLVAPNVILELPVMAPQKREAETPAQRLAAAADRLAAASRSDVPRRECAPVTPAPSEPNVRSEGTSSVTAKAPPPAPPGGGFLALERPGAQPLNAAPKRMDAETRALIDKALAEGRVTKCPPRTFSQAAGEPDAHSIYAQARRRAAKQKGAK